MGAEMPDNLAVLTQLEPALGQGKAPCATEQVLERATVRFIDPGSTVEGETRFGVTEGRPEGSLGETIQGALGPASARQAELPLGDRSEPTTYFLVALIVTGYTTGLPSCTTISTRSFGSILYMAME